MNVTVDIQDSATESLRKLVAQMVPERAAKAVGPKLRESVRDHIKRLPKNRRGWPSTGFWEDAARACTWSVKGQELSIEINKIGFRQRYYGGTIEAVKAKFLTIPISSQAYGKTVADFPGSFIIRTPKGAYIVQYGGSVSKTGKKLNKNNASLEFLFKLQRSVNQAENRSIIPSQEVLVATAIAQMSEHFRKVKGGQA